MDFSSVDIPPEERRQLMDKVQSGKRLTKEEALRVASMLIQIIDQDSKTRTDAQLFLATLAARYGIEVKVD